MWGLVQSHGDLKLITLSNHIVKVSSTVRSSETSVILLLSFFFFFFLREVFPLGFRGTSCQAGDVSVIEASAADEFEYYCINASFVCRRTQKVRPDGLITLHIPVLTAHRLACCKHPSNLHYHLECVFFFFFFTPWVRVNKTLLAELVLPRERSEREREREREKIQGVYLLHHHDRHDSAPSCSLCNHMNNNLVDVVSVL